MDMSRRRSFAKSSLVALIVLGLCYVVADVAYRLYAYHRLESSYKEYLFWTTEALLYDFDPDIGYRYHAGAHVHLRMYSAKDHLLHSSTLAVNNLGHLSPEPDSFEKPASEFRIVTLGDSFTSCPHSDISWPTALQDLLNKDQALKRAVGRSVFKVVNLAQDGTGLVQFARVDAFEGVRYAPDLVIVNFITDDITRKFVYRNPLQMRTEGVTFGITVTSPSLPVTLQNSECVFARLIAIDPAVVVEQDRLAKLKRYIYDESVRRLPWFSLRPSLLLRAVGGRFGVKPKIESIWDQTNPRYQPTEAIRVGIESLEAIRSRHPKMVTLYHPTEQELLARETPPLGQEFLRQSRDLRIIEMAGFLPTQPGSEEIKRWYNADDKHPSDHGAQVYAQAVYQEVRQYLLSEGAPPE